MVLSAALPRGGEARDLGFFFLGRIQINFSAGSAIFHVPRANPSNSDFQNPQQALFKIFVNLLNKDLDLGQNSERNWRNRWSNVHI